MQELCLPENQWKTCILPVPDHLNCIKKQQSLIHETENLFDLIYDNFGLVYFAKQLRNEMNQDHLTNNSLLRFAKFSLKCFANYSFSCFLNYSFAKYSFLCRKIPFSPCIMCVQYSGGFQYCGGYHDARGRYFEYHGDIQ